ncbi:MAG: addiction module toxin RelE [Robiginitomaculum sp.]|nr:MAG: addiction module toxin RelE [Robiginitomaculum sp.]
MKTDKETSLKPLFWVGNCLGDLRAFPDDVKDSIGFALHEAQMGGKSRKAKPFKGYKGSGVLEVVDRYDGDTYRAVYTVRFKGAVFALHAFQKKAKKGIATPKPELDMIKRRLRAAEEKYTALQKERKL